MDFEVRRGFERPFIEIRIAGPLSIASSQDRIGRLIEDEHYQQGMHLLFDLRQAELSSLDLNFMQSLKESTSRLSEQDAASLAPEARRVVFLVASEADELIMKLYKEMLEISPTSPDHDRRIFRRYDPAAAWVGGKAVPETRQFRGCEQGN
ncbi:hypothetical protein [Nisaea sediminum]|uniref:hypothetical protein n=1 Tax=Nisaea sediminum TaxID=2775867 RepID=UPI001868F8B1|nr:hypothetical protein [Nisaea sediminum]